MRLRRHKPDPGPAMVRPTPKADAPAGVTLDKPDPGSANHVPTPTRATPAGVTLDKPDPGSAKRASTPKSGSPAGVTLSTNSDPGPAKLLPTPIPAAPAGVTPSECGICGWPRYRTDGHADWCTRMAEVAEARSYCRVCGMTVEKLPERDPRCEDCQYAGRVRAR